MLFLNGQKLIIFRYIFALAKVFAKTDLIYLFNPHFFFFLSFFQELFCVVTVRNKTGKVLVFMGFFLS